MAVDRTPLERGARADAALALLSIGSVLTVVGTTGLLARVVLRHLVAHSAFALVVGAGAIAWSFTLQTRSRRVQLRPTHRARPIPVRVLPMMGTPVAVVGARVRVDAWIGPPRALPRG